MLPEVNRARGRPVNGAATVPRNHTLARVCWIPELDEDARAQPVPSGTTGYGELASVRRGLRRVLARTCLRRDKPTSQLSQQLVDCLAGDEALPL